MVAAGARGGYAIVDGLNADWDDLRERHRDIVRRWSTAHQSLCECDTLSSVLDAVRRDPDGTLLSLLTESAAGDGLAARVVLQAMLGKIVRMAQRDASATADDYVAAMWCRISTYPLRERRFSIAANLALDTLKAVRSEAIWVRRGVTVRLVRSDLLIELESAHRDQAHPDQHGLTADSLLDTASELGLIDGATRQVLLSVYADGLSGRAAAELHATTADMVRYRCSRAVRRLAEHSAALAEAA